MIWSTKRFPAQYYIFIYFLIFSGQVSCKILTLMQKLLCLSLSWDENVDLKMNFHRNKYFTELSVWYWFVTINMKLFPDIVPPIKVFVTYLIYKTLALHPLYSSLQCLHNTVSYWYMAILGASSHIFKNIILCKSLIITLVRNNWTHIPLATIYQNLLWVGILYFLMRQPTESTILDS